jgi:hypothetical protein
MCFQEQLVVHTLREGKGCAGADESQFPFQTMGRAPVTHTLFSSFFPLLLPYMVRLADKDAVAATKCIAQYQIMCTNSMHVVAARDARHNSSAQRCIGGEELHKSHDKSEVLKELSWLALAGYARRYHLQTHQSTRIHRCRHPHWLRLRPPQRGTGTAKGAQG